MDRINEYATVAELVDRLQRFLGKERYGIRTTTTQAKLGLGALREIVTLLETHVDPVRGCGRCDESGVEWCETVPGGCIRGRA